MSKGKDAKPHIGIYGKRNIGKSSIINALAGQEVAIVSDYAGTTTDPVKKSMEITGIGPVVLIDTAGIDDVGELGKKRTDKTRETLKHIDLAILVFANNDFSEFEQHLISQFQEFALPFVVIHNKSDIATLNSATAQELKSKYNAETVDFNTIDKIGFDRILDAIKQNMPESAYKTVSLVGDLVNYGDVVLLVTPIDAEAPEGRLILPQVQTIRDALDNDCIVVVVKERELDYIINKLQPRPKLVITDSQAFLKVAASVPTDIELTSFSIILARQKGDFNNYLLGTPYISRLQDGNRILILESCTHHVSCDDIGRIKIPRWLGQFTGKKLEFDVVAGLNKLPRAINEYSLVVQCGGCMLTRKQVINRLKPAVDAGIPVTNYGMTIAYVHGIFNRAVAPFYKTIKSSVDYL